jgi:hypothetical protein
VLRSTSVSSSRRIIVPAFRRAYNQLKINVRALPTCRKPVGEGAKRTLNCGFGADDGLVAFEVDMKGVTDLMLRAL